MILILFILFLIKFSQADSLLSVEPKEFDVAKGDQKIINYVYRYF